MIHATFHRNNRSFSKTNNIWVETLETCNWKRVWQFGRPLAWREIEWFPKELVCSSPLQELPGYIIYYMEESAEQLHYWPAPTVATGPHHIPAKYSVDRPEWAPPPSPPSPPASLLLLERKSPVLCRDITSLLAPLVADISRGGLALVSIVSIVSSIELKTLATSNPSPPHAADWAPPLLIQKLGSSRSESGGDRRCHFRHFPFQTSEYISATQLDVSVLRGSTIAPGKGGCFRVGSTIPVGRLFFQLVCLEVKILWCHQPATKFIKTATHTLQEIKGNTAVS